MRIVISFLILVSTLLAKGETAKDYSPDAIDFYQMVNILPNLNADSTENWINKIIADLKEQPGSQGHISRLETVKYVLTSSSLRKIYQDILALFQKEEIPQTKESNLKLLEIFANYPEYENKVVKQEQLKGNKLFNESVRKAYFREYLIANAHFSTQFINSIFPQQSLLKQVKGFYQDYKVAIQLAALGGCVSYMLWAYNTDLRPPLQQLHDKYPRVVQPQKQYVDPAKEGQRIGEELFDNK